MIVNVYSVKDTLNGFTGLTLDLNDDLAVRSFKFAVNNNEVMSFSANDYDLYRLGTFNVETGKYAPLDLPQLIFRGVNAYGE